MTYSPVNEWTFPFDPSFPLLPAAKVISGVSNASSAVITTSTDHGYTTGMFVRIFYPFPYQNSFGMPEINGQTGQITVLSPTTFSININTILYGTFSIGTALQTPQILPIGELASSSESFEQVNPPNPQTLDEVRIFQNIGLQFPAGTSRS